MSTFPPAMPHGDLREIFPDVFFVTGTSRPHFQGMDWQFSRNMIVVRERRSLTLINTVRLDDGGLARLDALGEVQNVVKLGAFHGIDDGFYLDRHGAALWALPGMMHESGRQTDHELVPGGAMPFGGCSLFAFETSSAPEGLLLLDRAGGVLVSCDSLQNWREADEYFSDDSRAKMTALGFIKPANVGPGWRQGTNVKAADFDRLRALAFRHLLPAHGEPLLDDAHAQLSATFDELFPRSSI